VTLVAAQRDLAEILQAGVAGIGVVLDAGQGDLGIGDPVKNRNWSI
jgi:hypothetical protein